MIKATSELFADNLRVRIYGSRTHLARAAAVDVRDKIVELLENQASVRVIFTTGPGQNEFLQALSEMQDAPWQQVTAFHIAEYLDLSPDTPQCHGTFLRLRLFDKLPFEAVHYLDCAANDPEAECERYANLLEAAPIDIVCVEIGENGNLAFIDPPWAFFNDHRAIKVVELSEARRWQQINDGLFERLIDVPKRAMTLSLPTLMSSAFMFVSASGANKRTAVLQTVNGPISPACPASVIRTHMRAILYLDPDSSQGL